MEFRWRVTAVFQVSLGLGVTACLAIAPNWSPGSADTADTDVGDGDGDSDGTCDEGCPSPTSCDQGQCVSPYNVAFVTSDRRVAGEIGGPEGADQWCMDAAGAAGLPGNYVAWMATEEANAVSRLGSANGWIRTDGRVFSESLARLLSDGPRYPLMLDEFGQHLDVGDDAEPFYVATGAMADGSWNEPEDCEGFTSTDGFTFFGKAHHAGANWTDHHGDGCEVPARIYCLGVDEEVGPVFSPQTGRLVFALSQGRNSGNGRDAFDDACQEEAEMAGYNGNFVALLGNQGESASERLDSGSSGWVRPDGLEVVPQGSSDWDSRLAGVFLTAEGNPVSGWFPTYGLIGSFDYATPVSPTEENCFLWTTTSADSLVYVSRFEGSVTRRVHVGGDNSMGCDDALRVICAEL